MDRYGLRLKVKHSAVKIGRKHFDNIHSHSHKTGNVFYIGASREKQKSVCSSDVVPHATVHRDLTV